MEAFDSYLNDLVNKNKEAFSSFPNVTWLHPYNSTELRNRRKELLRQLEDSLLFKDTKPYHKQISKGSMICGLGAWSCLFITGKCNANCFYCPVPQLTDEVPKTQNAEIREQNLLHKKIFIKTENAMAPIVLKPEQKIQVDEILKKEPEKIPKDPLLFSIWQMEYIEKGLREI